MSFIPSPTICAKPLIDDGSTLAVVLTPYNDLYQDYSYKSLFSELLEWMKLDLICLIRR
jgi:hypothetical protein